jgi:hypothetical protein
MRTPQEQADFDLLCDLESRVEARLAKVGYEALSEAERVLWSVWCLEAEVNDGGFDQYFFNSAGDHALDVVKALVLIGAKQCAEIVRMAIGLFPPSGPSREREARCAQLELLRDAHEAELSACDDAFYEYLEPLETLLATFARSRIEDFPQVVGGHNPQATATGLTKMSPPRSP